MGLKWKVGRPTEGTKEDKTMKLMNRKGQGTTEYIVIVAIVLIGITFFWKPISQVISNKVNEIVGSIASAGH